MKFYDSIKLTLWPLTLLICLLVVQVQGSNNHYMKGFALVSLLAVVLSTPFTFYRIIQWFFGLFIKSAVPLELESSPVVDKKMNLKWEREWIIQHGTSDCLRRKKPETINSYKPKFDEQILLDRKFR